ncbi:MAG: SDR family NAD(P)-dependent oxidoreductase [Deltaproteobacteria bacterium]|nr:SDR family NAD(P)-dependent oxidoreductase [Deltaproteobacteria bacterium]
MPSSVPVTDEAFRSRYGPAALVTGGSQGIGEAFARELARRGLDLVLLSNDGPELDRTARRIAADHGVTVRTARVDLARPDLLEVLDERTGELEIGLLVCSAARSLVGRFLDQDVEEKMNALDVNCRATLCLVHAFGRRMRERGRGGVIIMTSLAGLHGAALTSTYSATKAFDLVLGEALWEELRPCGVDVLSVCAGPTSTPTWEAARPRPGGLLSPRVMQAGDVVLEALDALGRRPTVIAGRGNRLSSFLLGRLLTRSAAARLVGRSVRSLFAHEDE